MFGSVFVSAVRFCGVSAGVSAAFRLGILRGFLRGFLPGSLRVFADWAVLFLRRFCGVSAGLFFWIGIKFWKDGQTDGRKKLRRQKFVSAANSS